MTENPQYRNYEVGEGTYGYPEINFYDAGAKLIIGKYCSFAPKVTILLGGEHHHDWVSSYPFSLMQEEASELPGYPMTKGDVAIGNDVWIGYEALILSGVTIGDGAVIAARSLVAKNVEPYSIVGGVPAKHLRFRFDQETVNELMRIRWWDWTSAEIHSAMPKLQSPNMQAFLDYCIKKDVRS
jgi:acetyltransferase-like isoleucine patch superfamily enzyme